MAAQILIDNEKFLKAKKYIEQANKLGDHYLSDFLNVFYYIHYEDDESSKYYIKKLLSYNYDFPDYLFCVFLTGPFIDYHFKWFDFCNFIKSHKKYKTYPPLDSIITILYALACFYFYLWLGAQEDKILARIENLFNKEKFDELVCFCKDAIHKRKNRHTRSKCYYYLSLVEVKNENSRKALKYINQSLLYKKCS